MKLLVLLSGGVDSVTALYHVHSNNIRLLSKLAAGDEGQGAPAHRPAVYKEVLEEASTGTTPSFASAVECQKKSTVVAALSFDYGSKHNHAELPMAAYHTKKLNIPHVILPLTFINDYFESHLLKSGGEIPEGHYAEESMKKTVVPFRNGIMLSIAGGFAESRGAQGVVIGAHAGDHFIYADCREEFLKSMSAALREGTDTRVEILRPFVGMNKGEIVRRGTELGVDYSQTWSCYKGEQLHCGLCGTCVERREAFQLAGVTDPTKYKE